MVARIASRLVVCCIVAGVAPAASGATREARIPLRDGKLDLGVCRVNLDAVRNSRIVAAANDALTGSSRLKVDADAVVLRFDLAKLPRHCNDVSRAVRAFTRSAAPDATAAQAERYGLFVPTAYDPARPLVILVHGLDCDQVNWGGMAQCLIAEGHQIGWFNYPSDQPIAESAASFATKMTALRKAFPRAEVNLLGYSMGGLVCRAYVEGDDYAGGVERLILVGTPNTGSEWSRVRYALELQEHYRLWRDDPKWSPSWMITDGLGEAGRDLRPGSRFLRELNARPRREGVEYTIVCGDQSPVRRLEAKWLDRTAASVPTRAANWWGVRQVREGLIHQANRVHNHPSAGDGAVSVERAKLDGVADTVIVHADHARLYLGTDKAPPAAWDTIRDRLAR